MTAQSLFNAVLFVCVGFLLFAGLLALVLRFLPGRLWDQAMKASPIGPAIVLAAIVLALGMIVAAAVH